MSLPDHLLNPDPEPRYCEVHDQYYETRCPYCGDEAAEDRWQRSQEERPR